MMQVLEKNPGPKIAYQESGTRLYLGDEELMLNVAKYQRDWPVQVDICSNRDNQLVMGPGQGLYYVAQLDIPAITYEPTPQEGVEGEGEPGAQVLPQALPLDMALVTLTLWSLDNPGPQETERSET